jgi:hypothetical protein
MDAGNYSGAFLPTTEYFPTNLLPNNNISYY